MVIEILLGFPRGSDSREFDCYVGDPGSIPGLRRSLEKGMAVHSSLLAWRIPWTEEPGGIQSMGSKTVRHDWATNTFTFSDISDITIIVILEKLCLW